MSMNMQEVYTKVRKHLLAQNAQARNKYGCRYRAEDGKACAIGCLIADEYYREEFEGNSVEDDRILYALESSGINLADGCTNREGYHKTMFDLLDELQNVHDHVESLFTVGSDWQRGLDQIAFYYNLKIEE